jgi:hypothetical protein
MSLLHRLRWYVCYIALHFSRTISNNYLLYYLFLFIIPFYNTYENYSGTCASIAWHLLLFFVTVTVCLFLTLYLALLSHAYISLQDEKTGPSLGYFDNDYFRCTQCCFKSVIVYLKYAYRFLFTNIALCIYI